MIRALLAKDLRVLRRSPALLALIVIYPVLIAVGLGLALTRDPQPPKIAVVNLLPQGREGSVTISGQKISIADLEQSIAGGDVQSINLPSREQAVAQIEAGTIDGALVIPEDAAQKLSDSLTTGGVTAGPELEVLYRSSGPLDGTLVRAVIASRLRSAERALASEIVRVASGFLEILRDGGTFEIFGAKVSVIGLRAAEILVSSGAQAVPPNQKEGLEQAARFARLARQNLDLSDSILKTIAQP
ncbi:MAG: ABC transporter permease, partial [Solirubrobacteraceae bacterium]|nr:ABC transporter permease [Solirubrobacteraceae bacterium]